MLMRCDSKRLKNTALKDEIFKVLKNKNLKTEHQKKKLR